MGKLVNPAAWEDRLPEKLLAALTEWVEGQPFDLRHRRWLVGGASGSYVAVVLMQHPNRLRGGVVKLVPPELAKAESSAVQLAQHAGPTEFVEAHLVQTSRAEPLPGATGYWLHLQDFAQVDVATLAPLNLLIDDAEFSAYCETIIRAMTTGWNPDRDDPPMDTVTPGAYLRTDLAGKKDALGAFAAQIGLSAGATTVTLPARRSDLPNPFRLLTDGVEGGPELMLFRGRGHGDLNLGNILVPVSRGVVQADRFQLIDYGRFSTTMAVSRDPSKLLLSICAHWLRSLVPGSAIRSGLAELVVAPDEYRPAPALAGCLSVVEPIWRAAAMWASTRRLVVWDWAQQQRLVLAAAAMRTVARADQSIDDRLWHLEVAALALHPLLDEVPQGQSAAVATIPPEPPVEMSPHRPTRETFSGRVKVAFSQRLGDDWRDIADLLGIPVYSQARFAMGGEARPIWEWLEARGRLAELRDALRAIGRPDLVELFDEDDQDDAG
ncbi:hypothetical protein [Actinoplanes sp. NPDC089786]|uniref:hypothetical protein n=1 Tax=Actinoplanes sp. NPDC089786 TaxID=3155185 RepID=UPI00344A74E6